MASDYNPTNVTQGFGAEVIINQNFNEIKTALDKMLSRLQNNDNALGQDLDMGTFNIINLPKAVSPTNPIRLQEANSLAIPDVVTSLAFSSTILISTGTTTIADITLEGNAIINFLDTPNDGASLLIRLRQDAIGSRLVTWDVARSRFSVELPAPVLTTDPSRLDYVLFRYNAADDKFDLLALNRNFI